MPCRELRFVLSVVFYVVNEKFAKPYSFKKLQKAKENT